MGEKRKAIIKDEILEIFVKINEGKEEEQGAKLHWIIDQKGLQSYYGIKIAKELIETGYLKLNFKDGYRAHQLIDQNAFLSITNEGYFFIKEEGGYFGHYKKKKREKYWYITKMTVAVLNALAILLISAYATFNKSETKLKEEINKKNKVIIELNNKLKKAEKQNARHSLQD